MAWPPLLLLLLLPLAAIALPLLAPALCVLHRPAGRGGGPGIIIPSAGYGGGIGGGGGHCGEALQYPGYAWQPRVRPGASSVALLHAATAAATIGIAATRSALPPPDAFPAAATASLTAATAATARATADTVSSLGHRGPSAIAAVRGVADAAI
ncbi:hypothetical protein JKP88DRAFT_351330 [Tribonema minus]|uniref:Uncharacterized protein n=1 Tax=Tribonema minus TaxID=303371 RepID=A0A836C7H5_9STRA|nr:hypothetical protein JKP88DRAFT_351330 [Tribonema minus]